MINSDPVPLRAHLVSLGCARNRVDSEVILGGLLQRGWQLVDEPESASAIIVNTCGFIGPAKEESIDTILAMAEHKKTNPNVKLVVSGCLTQRYKSQLVQGLPEVDLFIGTDEFPRIPELLEQSRDELDQRMFAKRRNYLYDAALPKLNTLSPWSAYVKVAEGCQHSCSFCIIPAIRGPLRSRPLANVLSEVKGLVAKGTKEINLIAQDLAAYGRDQGRADLLPLLQSLGKVQGLDWIRLLYMYPEYVDEQFLDFFASSQSLVKYIDIPAQHASDRVLKEMKRDVGRSDLERIYQLVRRAVPGVNIRTTVMVGFPGETEEEFCELLSFVQEQSFEHLGAFAYSQEDGTVAARLSDQVPEEVKVERLERLMTVQKAISSRRCAEKIGKKFDVLIESVDPEGIRRGRLSTQAPEVDGITFVERSDARPGDILAVKVVRALDYDLIAEPC